ncbi:hypothetical protein BHM03_00009480 [Ensete ventricosum]|uniref:Secreted protein n=1 Tax=Ensete ventricosum TaxID=4639 RepID=A0A445MCK2_ENSVE|nr:hypothetical protein BHM03_00009480 [Ensete ventricosum]
MERLILVVVEELLLCLLCAGAHRHAAFAHWPEPLKGPAGPRFHLLVGPVVQVRVSARAVPVTPEPTRVRTGAHRVPETPKRSVSRPIVDERMRSRTGGSTGPAHGPGA